ncbi:MAG: ATP-binding protein [Rickettsiales bacterium]|jgi:two-component system osmolarity sensor histidine kinase EnvZ|nr:ATP-binding protein [Rickettsiales bacterium]
MTLIPRSFLWRTVLMILLPLIIVQIIMANVFFGDHWSRVHSSMARSLSGEVAAMTNLYDSGNMSGLMSMARDTGINFSEHETLNRPKHNDNDSREAGALAHDLRTKIKSQTSVYVDRGNRLLFIDVPRDGKILTFATALQRVYSMSIETFLLWLALSVIIVALLVTPFIIIHTRSIHKIARAANRFGRGLDAPDFRPTGSREIRSAATALIVMKERLNRYNRTRTDMLNAVSHDLKAPLTRMRLAVETGGVSPDALMSDIDRMTEMVNEYLAFARGEVPEIEQQVALAPMITRLVREYGNSKKTAKLCFPDAPITFYARPGALSRALQNLIENAFRYAKKNIEIAETDTAENVEITIDDDGPGIPADKREEALRPFVRLDAARGSDTGGTGLGLTIAQTAIENHGGQIFLTDSPLGGLRVRIVLPV